MHGFKTIVERVTPESAEAGEAESYAVGFENCTLRYAIESISGGRPEWIRGYQIEANEWPCSGKVRWFTVIGTNANSRDHYETGAIENVSIHIPAHITAASRLRIARFLGVAR